MLISFKFSVNENSVWKQTELQKKNSDNNIGNTYNNDNDSGNSYFYISIEPW